MCLLKAVQSYLWHSVEHKGYICPAAAKPSVCHSCAIFSSSRVEVSLLGNDFHTAEGKSEALAGITRPNASVNSSCARHTEHLLRSSVCLDCAFGVLHHGTLTRQPWVHHKPVWPVNEYTVLLSRRSGQQRQQNVLFQACPVALRQTQHLWKRLPWRLFFYIFFLFSYFHKMSSHPERGERCRVVKHHFEFTVTNRSKKHFWWNIHQFFKKKFLIF